MITVKGYSDNDNLTDCSQHVPSLGISKHSLIQDVQSFTEGLLMSYQPGSPVQPSPLQENEKVKKTNGICGLKLSNVYAEYDPNMRFWKMCQGCLQFGEKGGVDTSGKYLQTFTKHGMTQNGVLSELMMSGLPIEERDCGFWLTPSTVQISGGEDRVQKRTEFRNSIGRKYVPGSLAEQIMWPTPRSQEPGRTSEGYGRGLAELCEGKIQTKNWPTPNTRDYKDGTAESCKNVPVNSLLGRSVRYPTPQASMMTESDMEQARFSGNNPNRPEYSKAGSGSLNPDWVCWLMGWPISWSSIEPMKNLLWLDWSIDPADMESNYTWNTPDCSDRRSAKSKQQGTSNQAKDRGSGGGFIPRIATGIKDRVNRLKAIGNGQVPQTVATAFRLLNNKTI